MTEGNSENDKPAGVNYRAARADDVAEMVELHRTAASDMFARNNVSFALPPREAVRAGYEHLCATGIFDVAEWENRIIAIAGANPFAMNCGISRPSGRFPNFSGRESGCRFFGGYLRPGPGRGPNVFHVVVNRYDRHGGVHEIGAASRLPDSGLRRVAAICSSPRARVRG